MLRVIPLGFALLYRYYPLTFDIALQRFPTSWNTINLSRIKAFSSIFVENPKFLFFHSTKNLFVYKLTSYSTASSTIFKYFKSQRWCLLKNYSSSVLLYLDKIIPRPYAFKNRTCVKILIVCKNRY